MPLYVWPKGCLLDGSEGGQLAVIADSEESARRHVKVCLGGGCCVEGDPEIHIAGAVRINALVWIASELPFKKGEGGRKRPGERSVRMLCEEYAREHLAFFIASVADYVSIRLREACRGTVQNELYRMMRRGQLKRIGFGEYQSCIYVKDEEEGP